MAKTVKYFPIILVAVISVQCDYSIKFPTEYDPIKIDIISNRNYNISNLIDGILFGDWLENIHCLVELNAIKRGLENFDEWGIKSRLFLHLYFWM